MKLFNTISILLIIGFIFWSCSDDTVVGSGLFDGEELGLEHVSDIDITAQTVMGDSILTYLSGSVSRQTYFMGVLEDPYFGKSASHIYLNCGITGNLSLPDFKEVTDSDLDSIVLALKLDTLGFYGDPDASFDIRVYRMLEDIRSIDTIYSNQDFMRDMMPIGEINNFKPAASATDTLEVDGSIFAGIGQIRIPLSLDLAREIIADTTAVKNDTSFMQLLNGFFIEAVPSSNSMLGVDLSPVAYQTDLSELAIYYSDSMKYGFSAGIVKTSRFSNDYSGSSVEEAINGSFAFGDSLMFVEGMAGTNIEIEFPSDLTQYSDRLLNFAELELTIATFGDYSSDFYPDIDLLIPSSENEDGDLNVLDDFAVISGSFIPEIGEVTEGGQTLLRYRIPLTRYIRSIIQGTNVDNTLILNAFLKSERPQRSIIYGVNHSTYPSKLRLTFTN